MQKPVFPKFETADAGTLEDVDLSVPEMARILQRIHDSLRNDTCLGDLAEPVRGVLRELKVRQRLAKIVAMQADASSQSYEN
jgi:hypothetical protein